MGRAEAAQSAMPEEVEALSAQLLNASTQVPIGTSMLRIFGRIGIRPVAVLVADLAISAMNDHFRLLRLGGPHGSVDGGGLCPVVGGNPGIPLPSHSPLTVVADNVLVFSQWPHLLS